MFTREHAGAGHELLGDDSRAAQLPTLMPLGQKPQQRGSAAAEAGAEPVVCLDEYHGKARQSGATAKKTLNLIENF